MTVKTERHVGWMEVVTRLLGQDGDGVERTMRVLDALAHSERAPLDERIAAMELVSTVPAAARTVLAPWIAIGLADRAPTLRRLAHAEFMGLVRQPLPAVVSEAGTWTKDRAADLAAAVADLALSLALEPPADAERIEVVGPFLVVASLLEPIARLMDGTDPWPGNRGFREHLARWADHGPPILRAVLMRFAGRARLSLREGVDARGYLIERYARDPSAFVAVTALVGWAEASEPGTSAADAAWLQAELRTLAHRIRRRPPAHVEGDPVDELLVLFAGLYQALGVVAAAHLGRARDILAVTLLVPPARRRTQGEPPIHPVDLTKAHSSMRRSTIDIACLLYGDRVVAKLAAADGAVDTGPTRERTTYTGNGLRWFHPRRGTARTWTYYADGLDGEVAATDLLGLITPMPSTDPEFAEIDERIPTMIAGLEAAIATLRRGGDGRLQEFVAAVVGAAFAPEVEGAGAKGKALVDRLRRTCKRLLLGIDPSLVALRPSDESSARVLVDVALTALRSTPDEPAYRWVGDNVAQLGWLAEPGSAARVRRTAFAVLVLHNGALRTSTITPSAPRDQQYIVPECLVGAPIADLEKRLAWLNQQSESGPRERMVRWVHLELVSQALEATGPLDPAAGTRAEDSARRLLKGRKNTDWRDSHFGMRLMIALGRARSAPSGAVATLCSHHIRRASATALDRLCCARSPEALAADTWLLGRLIRRLVTPAPLEGGPDLRTIADQVAARRILLRHLALTAERAGSSEGHLDFARHWIRARADARPALGGAVEIAEMNVVEEDQGTLLLDGSSDTPAFIHRSRGDVVARGMFRRAGPVVPQRADIGFDRVRRWRRLDGGAELVRQDLTSSLAHLVRLEADDRTCRSIPVGGSDRIPRLAPPRWDHLDLLVFVLIGLVEHVVFVDRSGAELHLEILVNPDLARLDGLCCLGEVASCAPGTVFLRTGKPLDDAVLERGTELRLVVQRGLFADDGTLSLDDQAAEPVIVVDDIDRKLPDLRRAYSAGRRVPVRKVSGALVVVGEEPVPTLLTEDPVLHRLPEDARDVAELVDNWEPLSDRPVRLTRATAFELDSGVPSNIEVGTILDGLGWRSGNDLGGLRVEFVGDLAGLVHGPLQGQWWAQVRRVRVEAIEQSPVHPFEEARTAGLRGVGCITRIVPGHPHSTLVIRRSDGLELQAQAPPGAALGDLVDTTRAAAVRISRRFVVTPLFQLTQTQRVRGRGVILRVGDPETPWLLSVGFTDLVEVRDADIDGERSSLVLLARVEVSPRKGRVHLAGREDSARLTGRTVDMRLERLTEDGWVCASLSLGAGSLRVWFPARTFPLPDAVQRLALGTKPDLRIVVAHAGVDVRESAGEGRSVELCLRFTRVRTEANCLEPETLNEALDRGNGVLETIARLIPAGRRIGDPEFVLVDFPGSRFPAHPDRCWFVPSAPYVQARGWKGRVRVERVADGLDVSIIGVAPLPMDRWLRSHQIRDHGEVPLCCVFHPSAGAWDIPGLHAQIVIFEAGLGDVFWVDRQRVRFLGAPLTAAESGLVFTGYTVYRGVLDLLSVHVPFRRWRESLVARADVVFAGVLGPDGEIRTLWDPDDPDRGVALEEGWSFAVERVTGLHQRRVGSANGTATFNLKFVDVDDSRREVRFQILEDVEALAEGKLVLARVRGVAQPGLVHASLVVEPIGCDGALGRIRANDYAVHRSRLQLDPPPPDRVLLALVIDHKPLRLGCDRVPARPFRTLFERGAPVRSAVIRSVHDRRLEVEIEPGHFVDIPLCRLDGALFDPRRGDTVTLRADPRTYRIEVVGHARGQLSWLDRPRTVLFQPWPHAEGHGAHDTGAFGHLVGLRETDGPCYGPARIDRQSPFPATAEWRDGQLHVEAGVGEGYASGLVDRHGDAWFGARGAHLSWRSITYASHGSAREATAAFHAWVWRFEAGAELVHAENTEVLARVRDEGPPSFVEMAWDPLPASYVVEQFVYRGPPQAGGARWFTVVRVERGELVLELGLGQYSSVPLDLASPPVGEPITRHPRYFARGDRVELLVAEAEWGAGVRIRFRVQDVMPSRERGWEPPFFSKVQLNRVMGPGKLGVLRDDLEVGWLRVTEDGKPRAVNTPEVGDVVALRLANDGGVVVDGLDRYAVWWKGGPDPLWTADVASRDLALAALARAGLDGIHVTVEGLRRGEILVSRRRQIRQIRHGVTEPVRIRSEILGILDGGRLLVVIGGVPWALEAARWCRWCPSLDKIGGDLVATFGESSDIILEPDGSLRATGEKAGDIESTVQSVTDHGLVLEGQGTRVFVMSRDLSWADLDATDIREQFRFGEGMNVRVGGYGASLIDTKEATLEVVSIRSAGGAWLRPIIGPVREGRGRVARSAGGILVSLTLEDEDGDGFRYLQDVNLTRRILVFGGMPHHRQGWDLPAGSAAELLDLVCAERARWLTGAAPERLIPSTRAVRAGVVTTDSSLAPFAEGWQALGDGRPEDALLHFAEASIEDPSSIDPIVGRAVALSRTGQHDAGVAVAVQLFRRLAAHAHRTLFLPMPPVAEGPLADQLAAEGRRKRAFLLKPQALLQTFVGATATSASLIGPIWGTILGSESAPAGDALGPLAQSLYAALWEEEWDLLPVPPATWTLAAALAFAQGRHALGWKFLDRVAAGGADPAPAVAAARFWAGWAASATIPNPDPLLAALHAFSEGNCSAEALHQAWMASDVRWDIPAVDVVVRPNRAMRLPM